MKNNHKPPRPPPLSVSQPSNPPSQLKPKPNSRSNSDESPKSPLRSEIPHRSDDQELDHHKNGGAIVAVEKYYSPLTSPLPITPPKDASTPDNFPSPPHQIIHFNRREEALPQSGVVFGDGAGGVEKKGRVGVGGGEKKGRTSGGGAVRFAGMEDIGRRSKKEGVVEKVNLGVRVLEIVFCLISFSVMAANKTQGWSGDSFDRYKEYRSSFSLNSY